MEIKAVKLYEDGFMTEYFALGGGQDSKGWDDSRTFPSCLQNFLIDTGDEIILVDTGYAKDMPYADPVPGQQIYPGKRMLDYVSALEALGYRADQVTKILLTHKHPDHSGALSEFPHAKIYVDRADADALGLEGPNVVLLDFADGPYYNFPRSQKIAEGIRFLPAYGHTLGNSIVVAEADDLFYMLHGDITYTDAALHQNKLSIVFEDLDAAWQSLAAVRMFIEEHPTVYLSTHTPEALEHLERREIMEL